MDTRYEMEKTVKRNRSAVVKGVFTSFVALMALTACSSPSPASQQTASSNRVAGSYYEQLRIAMCLENKLDSPVTVKFTERTVDYIGRPRQPLSATVLPGNKACGLSGTVYSDLPWAKALVSSGAVGVKPWGVFVNWAEPSEPQLTALTCQALTAQDLCVDRSSVYKQIGFRAGETVVLDTPEAGIVASYSTDGKVVENNSLYYYNVQVVISKK